MEVKAEGLEETLGHLNRLDARIAVGKAVFLKELARLGIEVADVTFREAQYDGINGVMVYPEWDGPDTLKVVAYGHSVLFIEFGSGVYYNKFSTYGAKYGYEIGGYGKHKGLNDTWWYTDSLKGSTPTHGNPPARAMYFAGMRIRDEIERVAREVFIGD